MKWRPQGRRAIAALVATATLWLPALLLPALLLPALLLPTMLLALPASASTYAFASSGSGWVRLAHLSPNTPAVDVYLYSFGAPQARLVLHDVSYGMVSPYQDLPDGEYTVSMRAAGAAPASQPVLSTAFWVRSGAAYTVAGMGPEAGLRLRVLPDSVTVPAGRVLVRVIEASMTEQQVTVRLASTTLARNLRFAAATSYLPVAPGTEEVRVAGAAESAELTLPLAADSAHTLVVLDGADGLRITDLVDSAGIAAQPHGGAATGLGGTAPHPVRSPWPWLAVIAAGVVLAAAGGRRALRRRTPAGEAARYARFS